MNEFFDDEPLHVSLDERIYNFIGQLRSLYLQDHNYVVEPEPNDAIQRWLPGCEFDLDSKALLEALLDRFEEQAIDRMYADADDEDFEPFEIEPGEVTVENLGDGAVAVTSDEYTTVRMVGFDSVTFEN